jgi:hypothetical protein
MSLYTGLRRRTASIELPGNVDAKTLQAKKSRRSDRPCEKAYFVGLLIYQFLSKRQATFI